MATIGWIKVGAAVDTSQFHKGMKDMEGETVKFKDVLAKLNKYLAIVGVTLGAKAAIDWVRNAIAATAETQILASRLGMTTESFQKLAYAAKLSGVDQETFTHSLEKMNERLAEVAISGAGPAAETLKRFGVTADSLVKMAPDQAFLRLVGVLQQIPNAMERAAVAKDIFGRSGQGMINLAMQGTEELRKMGVEASALGVAMSGIDNARLAEANVGFLKIGSAIQGVADSIAVVLAPYITAVTDQFIAWMSTGTKAGSYVAQSIDWVTMAIGGVADAVQILSIGFYSLRSLFEAGFALALQGVDSLIKGFGWLYDKITGTHLATTDFFKDWSALLEQQSKQDVGKAMDKMGEDWAHNTVRKLKDDLEAAALKRAEFGAKKQAAFTAPGGQVTPKVAETKFASGAAELGSVSGYSAMVQAKARQFDSKQNMIIENTSRTASATERIAIAVEKSRDQQAGIPGVDGQQFRAQASGR